MDDEAAILEDLNRELHNSGISLTDVKQKYKFIPSPGPQTEAYFSKADILLFGGEAGGGKSGLLLGLALNEHERSLIVRSQFTDLNALTDELVKFYGSRDGFVSSPRPKLTTEQGQLIEFGALSNPGDEFGWQGRPHDLLCVGKGTPVLMGDKSYKMIEEIKCGEFVMTLGGARRVNRVFPRQLKHSVRLDALSARKEVIASQIQSCSHSVLTSAGWISHDTSVSNAPLKDSLFLEAEPILNYISYKFLSHYLNLYQESCRRLVLNIPPADSSFLLQILYYHLFLQDFFFYKAGINRDNDFLGMNGIGRVLVPRVLSRRSLTESLGRAPSQVFYYLLLPIFFRGGGDVQSLSLFQDYLSSYSSGSHPYDGRTRQSSGLYPALDDVRLYLHQSNDVGRPIPNYSGDDAQAGTRKYNRHVRSYAHPYTKDECQTQEGISEVSYKMTPVGVKELYDIEVDEVNHYITANGFINKNCFDEGVQLREEQIRFMMGWLRTTKKNQRCRVVIATNPPVKVEGEWIIDMFAPWLDPTHPNPAKQGELRWYITNKEGKDEEVSGPENIMREGKIYRPMSRTFIRSKLSDNPYLSGSGYESTLDAMPEPYRSAMRDGNFMLARREQAFQMIPTQWIMDAVARWKAHMGIPPPGIPMCAIGADVSGGGEDPTAISRRYDYFFDKFITIPGKDTKNGEGIAGPIMICRRDNAFVTIDMGGGYGNVPYKVLRENLDPERIKSFKGSEGSSSRTSDRMFGFTNRRTEAYWKFRELLDPTQTGGSPAMIPDDREMIAELAAPTYELTNRGIKMETKEEVQKKLGRSPNKSDAIVIANLNGARGFAPGLAWGSTKNSSRNPPPVVLGYANRKNKRG